MKANHEKTYMRLTDEIRELVKDLPIQKRHQLLNRLDKLDITTKKLQRQMDNTETINVKMNSRKAIYEALIGGRHLSQLDCAEFMIEDMRTCVSHLRKKFEDTHILHKAWITTPVRKARIREYWLERRVEA